MRCTAALLAAVLIGLVGRASGAAIDVQIELPAEGFALAHDVQRQQLYVSVPTLDEIVAVSTRTFEIVDRIVVGGGPLGIDLSFDSAQLFVALNEAGAVATLNLESGATSEIPVGEALQSSLTYDVLEVEPGRLLVTASPYSSGLAVVGQIRLGQGAEVSVVANGSFIRATPVLAVSADRHFAYVGEGFSPNSLYKLDLTDEAAPIVLEDDHGSVFGTHQLALNPDGSRIFLGSGQVLRTASFIQSGMISAGIPRFGTPADTVYVAKYKDFSDSTPIVRIGEFDTTTLQERRETAVDCAGDGDRIRDMIVLPDGQGFVVLNADLVCVSVPDSDDDGAADVADNCPAVANPLQENGDGDLVGDVCDNCAIVANSGQENADGDLVGDACDTFPQDFDNDGVSTESDNCPARANAGQEDGDGDRLGDACDPYPDAVDNLDLCVEDRDMALSELELLRDQCPGDVDRNKTVTITELIRAVNAALGGCE